jgi:GH18 family chitinase
MRKYEFDGIDIDWELKEIYVKKESRKMGYIWNGLKKKFGIERRKKDEKEEENSDEFKDIIKEIKKYLRKDGILMKKNVMKNVEN